MPISVSTRHSIPWWASVARVQSPLRDIIEMYFDYEDLACTDYVQGCLCSTVGEVNNYRVD